MMPKILVTGGTGFIGQNLIPQLVIAGYRVVTTIRHNSKVDDLPTNVTQYLISKSNDIDTIFANEEIDAVIHLATNYSHEVDHKASLEMLESNIIFGSLLLSAMTRNGCYHLVNTTSCAEFNAYGDYSPNSLYAASKRAFRDICEYYVNNQELKRIDLVLYDNYGPHDQRGKLLSLLCRALVSGDKIALSPGDQQLNLVHVDDTVKALIVSLELCLRKKEYPLSDIYSVAPVESISVKLLVSTLESIYHKTLRAQWGARPYRLNELMTPWVGQPVPGWSPSVTLREGLKQQLMAATNFLEQNTPANLQ